jgi:transposase InsO family protein
LSTLNGKVASCWGVFPRLNLVVALQTVRDISDDDVSGFDFIKGILQTCAVALDLKGFEGMKQLQVGLTEYFEFSNHKRTHSSLDGSTPAEVYLCDQYIYKKQLN